MEILMKRGEAFGGTTSRRQRGCPGAGHSTDPAASAAKRFPERWGLLALSWQHH